MEGEGEILGSNCDVVHIDSDCCPSGLVLSNGVAVQCIQHGLERGRRVSKAKEHHSGFIKPSSRLKCCFVLVSCLDADVVVSSPHVQFCVDHGSSQFSDERGDKGEQVLVAHRPFVNVPVILYRP